MNIFKKILAFSFLLGSIAAEAQIKEGNIYPDTLFPNKIKFTARPAQGNTTDSVLTINTAGDVRTVPVTALGGGTATDPTAIRQGGNSFGAAVIIGSTDAQDVILKANNTNLIGLGSNGQTFMYNVATTTSPSFYQVIESNGLVSKFPYVTPLTATDVSYQNTNSSGNAVVLSNNNPFVVVTPTLATQRLTVQMPPQPAQGQRIEIYVDGTCNGISITAPIGTAVKNGVANGAFAGGNTLKCTYVGTNWLISNPH